MSRTAEFGIFSPQAGMSFKAIADRATQAEQLGYHSLWFVDHFWNRGIPDADCLESMALMSGVAARTEKLRIGTLVLCNSFRNPALLAKALTTIDHVSGGRLEIGLGAGWMDEEYRGYGYEFPTIGARLRQLEEGLKILKLLFGEKRASFAGRYYKLEDALNNPKPIQRPHPPITIGGSGEKVMLRIVAQYADRWNCPAGYKSFGDKLGVVWLYGERFAILALLTAVPLLRMPAGGRGLEVGPGGVERVARRGNWGRSWAAKSSRMTTRRASVRTDVAGISAWARRVKPRHESGSRRTASRAA